MADNIDIKALTREAEEGHGCSVRKQLEGLSFEDTLVTLQDMDRQNRHNLAEDNGLPRISMYHYMGTDKAVHVGLSYPRENWYNSNRTLFHTSLSLGSNGYQDIADRRYSCTDITKAKDKK